jgi:hypothetical protein
MGCCATSHRGGVVANMALVAAGLWQLHGCKLDPHQEAKDRARQARTQLTSLPLLSGALSVFVISQTAGNAFRLEWHLLKREALFSVIPARCFSTAAGLVKQEIQ